MRSLLLVGSVLVASSFACSSSDGGADAPVATAGAGGQSGGGKSGNAGSAGKGGAGGAGKSGSGGAFAKGGAAGAGAKAGAAGNAQGGAGASGKGGAAGAGASGGSTGKGGAGAGGSSAGASGGSGGGTAGAPGCGSEGWPTYGHDAHRSFASTGCLKGTLSTAWRYAPTPPMGETVGGVFHAITDGPSVYLSWRGHMGPYFGTPFVDKVGADGKGIWQYTVGDDSSFGSWISLAVGALVVNDDGLVYVDVATGKATHNAGVDYWGQTAPGEGRVYVVNAEHVDGPGVFVGAYDADQKQSWVQNQATGAGQFNPVDTVGGIAEDGGALFFAGHYMGTPPPMLESGVYAFDAAIGTPKWKQSSTPAGPPSAGGGLVYLAETVAGATQLVARKQSDGSVAWSATPGAQYSGGQPPVLAAGLAIVQNGTSILAYHADTGAPAWTAAVTTGFSFSGGYEPAKTMLAAAIGSGTLVALGTSMMGKPSVTILDLASGAVLGTTEIAMAMGTIVDPVIVGKRLYVTDGQGLVALDAP